MQLLTTLKEMESTEKDQNLESSKSCLNKHKVGMCTGELETRGTVQANDVFPSSVLTAPQHHRCR